MIVNVVQSKEVNYSWYGELIEDLKLDLRERPNCRLSFIHREGNRVAHSLAKLRAGKTG